MNWNVSSFLFGNDKRADIQLVVIGLSFLISFTLYYTGHFQKSGGADLLPDYAVALGIFIAALIGYWRGGLILSWAVVYASLLGLEAELLLIHHTDFPILDRLIRLFFQPTRVMIFLIDAVIFGTIGFGFGYLVCVVVRLVRKKAGIASD